MCLDIEDSPPRESTGAQLREAAASVIKGRDLSTISIKDLRRAMEAYLGLAEGALTARKDEVKAIAAELVAAATAAAQAPPAAQNASLKRPASEVAGAAEPVKKLKRATSAYFLFTASCSARVSSELAVTLGRKATMGEFAIRIGELWRGIPADEKKTFEDQSAEQKAELERNPVYITGKAPKSGGGGKAPKSGGGGSGKASQQEPPVTRAEFLQNPVTLRCLLPGLLQIPENDTDAPQAFESQGSSRLFKSGSVGWYQGGKAVVEICGKKVYVQVGLNITACGSKNWLDGEGLENFKPVDTDKVPPEDAEVQRSSTAASSAGIAPVADMTVETPAVVVPVETLTASPAAEITQVSTAVPADTAASDTALPADAAAAAVAASEIPSASADVVSEPEPAAVADIAAEPLVDNGLPANSEAPSAIPANSTDGSGSGGSKVETPLPADLVANDKTESALPPIAAAEPEAALSQAGA